MIAVCVHEGCSWRIHASWDRDRDVFQIKTCSSEHNCGGTLKNFYPDSTFLSRKYLDYMRNEPDMKPETLIRLVKRKTNLNITELQAWGARARAKEIMHEKKSGEQFHVIRQYVNFVRKQSY